MARLIKAALLERRDAMACADVDPEVFFPLEGDTRGENAAKAVCAACAVRAHCMVWAISVGEQGVWGGTTEAEREVLGRHRRGTAVRRSKVVAA